jgi:hypothetical protein
MNLKFVETNAGVGKDRGNGKLSYPFKNSETLFWRQNSFLAHSHLGGILD